MTGVLRFDSARLASRPVERRAFRPPALARTFIRVTFEARWRFWEYLARRRRAEAAPLHCDQSWIGATISVDGQPVGRITAGHNETVDVPLGRHVLKVEKAGRAATRREITVPDGTLR